jgi:hypothetical protein
MRQAASPKHAVSIKAATSRSIQEIWLNTLPPENLAKFRVKDHGVPSRKMQPG